MELEHRAILRKQHQHVEFAAAAREGVTRLMSIDANHAKEDIQRSIDNSTGELRDQLQRTGAALAQQAEQSQISTRVIVDAVAVEWTTDDRGIILVAARSDNVYPDSGKREMKAWRISVDLTRVGGQLKMAKVDFLQ
jgi:Mce-associated membrane protein